MKKLSFLLVALLMSVVGISQNHWVPDMYQFPTNMNVIAIIEVNGMEQQNEYLELGVFCGDECRGSKMLKFYADPISRYMIFLTVYGENGDPFTFRLYDHLTGQELDYESVNEMTYLSNDIIGELFEPYVFAFTGGDCAVDVSAVPSLAGEVTGGGVMPCGTYCTVEANPLANSEFIAWMLNGDTLTTENQFSFNAVADIDLEAHFSLQEYTITLSASPDDAGTVEGGGDYIYGEQCEAKATPFDDYEFVGWSENGEIVSVESTYTFEVESDRTLVANFIENVNPETFVVNAKTEPEEGGTVNGAGSFDAGALCSLSVSLKDKYEFLNWTENGNVVSTNNNYSFIVNQNRNLVANLVFVSDVDENMDCLMISPNPTTGKVWVALGDGHAANDVVFVVCDMNGRVLLTTTENPIDISGFDDGVYLVSVGGGMLHKLILQR